MNERQRARAEQAVREARDAQQAAEVEERRIRQTLEQSERVDAEALPVLKEAGLVHS